MNVVQSHSSVSYTHLDVYKRQAVINDALIKCEMKHISGWSNIKNIIRDTLKNFLWQKTKRSPMILPIIMEV